MCPGVHSLYDSLVATGEVDRAEWAKVIFELRAEHARGKTVPFASLVKVNPRTVTHWLDKTVAVTEPRVRQVAEALSLNAMDLLIRVGFYSLAERYSAPEKEEPEVDEELSMILEADVDDVTKQMMIERLYELREQDKQRRLADLRWTIQQNQRRSA